MCVNIHRIFIINNICSDSCLDSNGFKQAGVPERQLHHLFNLCQLFTTAPDVIIPNVVQTLLLILTSSTQHMTSSAYQVTSSKAFVKVAEQALTHLSFDRLSLTVDNSIWSNNAMRGGVCFYHLKLHCSHTSSYQEYITWRRESMHIISFTFFWYVERSSVYVLILFCSKFNSWQMACRLY